ncbi:acylneuraminate cytidylyltransferase family protein [Ornithinimicrobium sp. Arc0846-15]|nr:acylneuraminate cytidylyltransferase family protein [Ornithinimicrobium laminariae]
MRILCLIPARGGSKGIPGKNLRLVAEKPLIAWTIEQALEADVEMDVVVSTDDEAIAQVAHFAGAQVPFIRPPELAHDATATEPVVEHAISFQTERGQRPDAVLLLQATSPVRLRGTLERAIAEFAANNFDSMVGVVPQAPFIWEAGDIPYAHYDVARRPRRQDLTSMTMRYRETGSLYVTSVDIYEEHHNRLGGRIGLFMMDEAEGIDIDTFHDLAVAEDRLQQLRKSGS